MKTATPDLPSDFPLRYVGRKEAALILGISVRSVDRLDGNDPSFPKARRILGRRRWWLPDLLDWMNQSS